MFFKSIQESEDLIEFLGFNKNNLIEGKYTKIKEYVELTFDGIAYKEFAASKKIVELLNKNLDSFLYLDEYGIWPSRDDWNLYYIFRSRHGDLRELNQAPGHYFKSFETTSNLLTMINMVLAFGWGGWLVQNSNERFMYISHHGKISIFET